MESINKRKHSNNNNNNNKAVVQLTDGQRMLLDEILPEFTMLARTKQNHDHPSERLIKYQPKDTMASGYFLLRTNVDPAVFNRFTRPLLLCKDKYEDDHGSRTFFPRVERIFLDPERGLCMIVENLVAYDPEHAKIEAFEAMVEAFFKNNKVGKMNITGANLRMTADGHKVVLVDLVEQPGPRTFHPEYIDHINTLLELHAYPANTKRFHTYHANFLWRQRLSRQQLESLNIADLLTYPNYYDVDYLTRLYVASKTLQDFGSTTLHEEHHKSCPLDQCIVYSHGSDFLRSFARNKVLAGTIANIIMSWNISLSDEARAAPVKDVNPDGDDSDNDDNDNNNNKSHYKRTFAEDYLDDIANNNLRKYRRSWQDKDDDEEKPAKPVIAAEPVKEN